MKRGFKELVGLQVTLSKVLPRYSMTHHYRWLCDEQVEETGTMRSFDLHRYISTGEILRGFRDAYASAIKSIWRRVTKASVSEYYQLQTGATPDAMHLEGSWEHWAQL